MKKRLTVLAATALCVTVGGVYATWTYAQDTATALEDQAISVTITTAEKISKGDIELVDNGLKLIVSNDGSYNTKLTLEGSITVKFTSAENAVETINVQYQLTASENWTYNGDAIFNVPTDTEELGVGNSWTVEASSLGITMPAVKLATYEEYESFKDALDDGSLTITFSEVETAA